MTKNEYTINMKMFFNENTTDNEIKKNMVLKKNAVIELDKNTIEDAYSLDSKWIYTIALDTKMYLKQSYKQKLLEMIKDSEIEWGAMSSFEKFVIKNRSEKSIISIINEIFIENIDNEDIIIKIFKAFSKLNYEETFPNAQTMCLATMAIDNVQIKEAAIELFESWRNFQSIELLEKIDIKEKWLKDYANKVISEIKEELKNV